MNNGFNIADHCVEVNKMVEIPSKSQNTVIRNF